MKATIKIEQEVEIKTLSVSAHRRYPEDATINGVEDTEGTLIPCMKGEMWSPEIDIESGRISGWEQGKTASIHFKVCDEGSYFLKDENGETILSIEQDYVPSCMCPKGNGYGDYIIMDIDENGMINNWSFGEPELEDFTRDDN